MTDQPEWWQDFFTGSVLDFVHHARDQERTHAEANFVEQAFGIPQGARVLDVPCGSGRLSLEMAARGYQVTGVDISPGLLETAQRSAKELNLQISWDQRDMRDLPWRGEFDAAFCFWSSFGYFDEWGNAEFLRAVSRCLKPGATFLLDTPLIETRLPEMEAQERVWWPVGDLLALEERSFDHETSRVESNWTLIKDGKSEQKTLSLRLYTYRELTLLLESAGFGNHQAYGSLDWEPYGQGSTWLYMITTKVNDPQ